MRPILILLVVIAGLIIGLLTWDFGNKEKPTQPTGSGTGTELQAPPVVRPPEQPAPLEDPQSRVEVEAAPLAQDGAAAPRLDSGVWNAVFGLVQDEQGKPIPETEVTLTRAGLSNPFSPDPGSERSRDRVTKTDADGAYRFENVEPWSNYSLVFRHASYKLIEEGSVNVGPSGDFLQPPVTMRPGIQLQGWVRDVAGVPIRGAEVALGMFMLGANDEKDPNALRTQTDANGHYVFEHVSKGVFMMTVSADGFGTVIIQNLRIINDEPQQHDVELEVAEMIAGRVMSITGEPIKKAQIAAYAVNQTKGKQSRAQTLSNDKGEFVIDDIIKGAYSLQIMAAGFEARREPRIDTGTVDQVIEMIPLPTISGRVLDAASGKPLTQFTVQLRQVVPNSEPPISIPEPETKQKVRDENGAYKLACLRPGPYEVQAFADNYAGCFSQQIMVAKGQNLQDVDVFMTLGGSIRGRVVDSQGQPVAGASITSQDHEWTDDLFTQALGDHMPTVASVRTVKSGSDGTFVLANLTPAQYLLDIQHPQYSREFTSAMRVSEGQETAAGDVQLISGGSVQGVVYSPEGTPLAGAVVEMVAQADPMGTPRNYRAKTDSKGAYTISGVHPGAYQISAIRSADASLDPFSMGMDNKNTQDKVNISNGETVTRNFHLGMATGDK